MIGRRVMLIAVLGLLAGLGFAAMLRRLPLAAQPGPGTDQYLSFIAAGGQDQMGCAVAVMPLGDSITQGYGASQMVGYRRELYHRLTSSGYQVNFVGSKQAGAVLDFDRDNEGHPGKEAYAIRDNMTAYLEANHPDIILLHIGTNGIGYKSAETIAAEIDQILSEIYRFDPGMMVFLARITNRTETEEQIAKTTRLNMLIQEMANQRREQRDPLAVVDMESVLAYSVGDSSGKPVLIDMYDRAHPNDSGYKKMTVVWDAALQGYLLQHCAMRHAPKITSSPVRETYRDIPYSGRVEASGNPVPSFALLQAPAGMAIDARSGQISWTPAVEGETQVTVSASNGVAPAATQTFTIHVAGTSDCPEETVAYYHLDEAASPFSEETGGPPATCSSCPETTTGQVNQALRFDGAGDLRIDGRDSRFDWGARDSFSIEFWLQRPGSCTGASATYNEVVVGRADAGSNLVWWVGLSCQHAGRARFAMRDRDGGNGDDADVVSQTILTGGDWHHVVAVHEWPAMDIRLYVDGVLEGITTAIFSSGFESASAPLTLGWLDRQDGFYLTGTMDEVAFYRRALTDREIQQHYAAGGLERPYCSLAE